MERIAGILQPVFAIRTGEDLGIGDTDGAAQLVAWCHRQGVRVWQMLPINETGRDHCPYNAISAMAIDPATIAVSPRHIPDLTKEAFRKLAPADLLAELRQGPVNYPRVKALKRALLEAAYARFDSRPNRRTKEFFDYIIEKPPWIAEYGMFRALMEENGEDSNWQNWPVEHQSPESARAWLHARSHQHQKEFRRRMFFFLYVQWLAFGQWQALKARAESLNVSLMGDMPIGLGRGSADVWANRPIFDLDWSAGAPPEKVFQADAFTEKWGQNWGASLYRWDELRRRNFDWWRTRVALARKVLHLCRVDHVMGLFRIYAFPWPPQRNAEFLPLSQEEAAAKTGGRLPGFRPFADDTAEHEAANERQGEEMLKLLLDAAGGMTVVAEDLGVVPGYVRATLDALGIAGFRVPSFCREPDSRYSDPAAYPRLSVTQPATHDHPPLAAAWGERWRDIDLGRNVSENQHELRRLMDFAGLKGEPPRHFTARLHEAVLRATLQANSWLAVLMLTDVFAETQRFNSPGTVTPDNWSARSPYTVAEMDHDPSLLAKARTFARLIRETGRGATS